MGFIAYINMGLGARMAVFDAFRDARLTMPSRMARMETRMDNLTHICGLLLTKQRHKGNGK